MTQTLPSDPTARRTLAHVDSVVFSNDVERVVEIIGIVVFALSGAMLAIRKDFDVVGVVVLATVTALGGGVIRDVLIGREPPIAFEHVQYLIVPIVAAFVAMVAHPIIDRMKRSILIFDAMGLALFTVNGTLIATSAGLEPLPAAVLGVTTGVGGGVLRDVIARDVPLVVQRRTELYAIPAVVGALLVAFLVDRGWDRALVGVAAIGLIFAIRAAAMRFRWYAPGAYRKAS